MLFHSIQGAGGVTTTATSISVVDFTTFFTTATTSIITMNKPTGTVSGDLMVAFITKSGGQDTYTQPIGWTELIDIGTAGRTFMVAYKVAGASEPTDYSWVGLFTGNNKAGNIITFRNASYDATAGVASNNTTTAPSVTATTNNSWLLLIGRTTTASTTITFAGATTIVSDSDANAPSSVIQYKEVNSGATGTITGTYSGSPANPVSFAMVLNRV
jgi:hypothetical protein